VRQFHLTPRLRLYPVSCDTSAARAGVSMWHLLQLPLRLSWLPTTCTPSNVRQRLDAVDVAGPLVNEAAPSNRKVPVGHGRISPACASTLSHNWRHAWERGRPRGKLATVTSAASRPRLAAGGVLDASRHHANTTYVIRITRTRGSTRHGVRLHPRGRQRTAAAL
jgi:hypothetical protein